MIRVIEHVVFWTVMHPSMQPKPQDGFTRLVGIDIHYFARDIISKFALGKSHFTLFLIAFVVATRHQ
jgi:hypothetical protein